MVENAYESYDRVFFEYNNSLSVSHQIAIFRSRGAKTALFWPENNKCCIQYQNRFRPTEEVSFRPPSASVRPKTKKLCRIEIWSREGGAKKSHSEFQKWPPPLPFQSYTAAKLLYKHNPQIWGNLFK